MHEDVFMNLFKKEEGKLYYIALGILGNEQDAWDAFQHTAEKAWQKRNSLKGGSAAFPAWIKKILLNQSLNLIRTRQRQIPTDPQEIPETIDFPHIQAEQDGSNIWELVQALGTEHRKVVALRYLGDLSIKEIASELNIATGTVKSRLNTAHDRLRQSFNKMERSD